MAKNRFGKSRSFTNTSWKWIVCADLTGKRHTCVPTGQTIIALSDHFVMCETLWSHETDKRYAPEEIRLAREWAREFSIQDREAKCGILSDDDSPRSLPPSDQIGGNRPDSHDLRKWEVLYTLLSDDAWGYWRCAHLVEDDFKNDVQAFCRNCSCDICDFEGMQRPANFMKANIHRTGAKGFIRMLRLCLILSPVKSESGATHEYCNDFLGEETSCFTPLQMSARSDHLSTHVMQTLLQAGCRVDNSTAMGDYGYTPLMIAMGQASTEFPEKVDILLDYGADIDAFSCDFNNSLHMAVHSENVRGLRTVLHVRQERLNPTNLPSWDTRLRKTGTGRCQEMINQPDESGATPLAIAAAHIRKGLFPDLNHWGTEISVRSTREARREMIDLIVQAGADANWVLSSHPYGWIQYNEYEDSVYIDIRNGSCDSDFDVDLDTIVEFVDYDISVLQRPNQPTMNLADQKKFVRGVFERLTYISCNSRRFGFEGTGIDGCDFDLYFSVHGDMTWLEIGSGYHNPSPRVTIYGNRDPNAEYKIAVRFPRGPWVSQFPNSSFQYPTSFKVNKQYTLAHRAVRGTFSFEIGTTEHAEQRRLMFSTARLLCNPLLKCSRGFTALELLRKEMERTNPSLEDENLLEGLQRDYDNMLAFFNRDATPYTKHRRVTNASRFHMLPGDVCQAILCHKALVGSV
jgi:hypothetical protein